jgi:hypothetical protein
MEPPSIPKSLKKPPLITPSASPPPVRAFFPQPCRLSGSAPPLKKKRFLSISRQSSVQSSSLATSTPEPLPDLQKEREASALRLLDVWSQLADRYTRRLDEDDIVDIRTGQIVKDNGVIRKSRVLKFGASSEPKNKNENHGAIEDGGVGGGEDDDDELNFFAPVNGESDEVNLDMDGRSVPPVAPHDPRDAEDLRQFMEAERIRKEACGSESEDDFESVPPFEDDDEDASDFERVTSDDAEEVDEGKSGEEGKEERGKEQDDKPDHPPWDRSQSVVDDSSSDDELNNYEVNEASIVYPTTKRDKADREAPTSDSDSEIEIIEPPIPTKASRTPKLTKEPSRTPHAQLQTPPHSKSSEDIDTSCSNYLVQPSASPPPILSSPASDPKVFPPKRGRGRPRLKSSAPLNSGQDEIPIPRIDLAELSKVNVQRRLLEKTTAEVLKSKKKSRLELEKSPEKIPRLVPEVVIVKRRPFGQEVIPSHPVSNVDGKNDVSPSEKRKGKEKEIAPDVCKQRQKTTIQPDIPGEHIEEDDEPIIMRSSSSVGPSKMKTHSAKGVRAVKKCHSPVLGPAECPREEVEVPVPADTRSVSSRPPGSEISPRKRKRVISSSESDALQDETFPSTVDPKAAKSKSSRQHRELQSPHHKLASKSGSEPPSGACCSLEILLFLMPCFRFGGQTEGYPEFW